VQVKKYLETFNLCEENKIALHKQKQKQNLVVLNLGVGTISRVAKYYLRVAKVYQYCPISTDSLHFVAFWGHRKLKIF
jgi:hypothetical protein